jgi:hypothetical protein
MAKHDDRGSAPLLQPFTFYAANGRIYASNVAQKLIDLGALTGQDGSFGYLLDGNQMSGRGFHDELAALRAVATKVRFLWLDGQFTALASARDDPDLNLDGATRLDVLIDEIRPDEKIVDATV